jgi:tetratricopeptide (TPR) repeat protein
MKYLLLSFITLLVACSSADQKKSVRVENVTNDDFKKPKVLAAKDIPDYYPENIPAASPALQDETLDRYTTDELKKLADSSDPLLGISVLCSRKDYEKSFALASKVFNEYQKVPGYWNIVANCHLNQGSYRKALLFYNKALEINPGYGPALNNIGVMYSRQGLDQKALIAFERANKQAKFSKTPKYNLARVYLAYGLVDLALPLFQALHSNSPQDADLLNALGTCYFLMSDYQRAWSYYQKIPADLWENAEYGLNIAVTLSKTSRKAEGLKVLKNTQEPKNGKLRNYYAAVEKQLGASE